MTTKTAGDRDPSRFNSAIRQLYAGGSNNTGQVTLTASATSTVVAHQSCNPKSHISLTPITANASIAFAPSQSQSFPTPKLLTVTRVLSLASGNVSYTGLGFKPKFVIFKGGVINTSNGYTSDGFDDATTHVSNIIAGNGASGAVSPELDTGGSGFVGDNSSSAYQGFSIQSLDSDGFTLSWTKVGSPTATATVYALCFPDPSAVISTVTAGVYISARSTGSFTITHRSNSAVDQTFTYSVTGGG